MMDVGFFLYQGNQMNAKKWTLHLLITDSNGWEEYNLDDNEMNKLLYVIINEKKWVRLYVSKDQRYKECEIFVNVEHIVKILIEKLEDK